VEQLPKESDRPVPPDSHRADDDGADIEALELAQDLATLCLRQRRR
jgi:hypothetical protein